MFNILCVEDTPETRVILEATFSEYPFYQLQFAESMKSAIELIERERFSFILLDIELPDGSGLDIYASCADLIRDVPVFFLTGRQDFAAKAAAFSLGAEDFIVKPFDPRELRIRVDAKLRRHLSAQKQTSVLRIGDFLCHNEEQRLTLRQTGAAIDLTALEFRLFSLLAKAPRKVFTRTEILDRVWGQTVSVTDRSVDVHISNLRRKLPGTSVQIEAVIGAGYRLQLS